MTAYEKQKEVIQAIRTELTANNLQGIDTIYRSHDRGKPQNEFFTITPIVERVEHSHICKDDKLAFYVDAYFKNEIKAFKYASLFIKRFYNFQYNSDGRRFTSMGEIGEPIEISKGLYGMRLKFDVFN
jgi:hypothetical protein